MCGLSLEDSECIRQLSQHKLIVLTTSWMCSMCIVHECMHVHLCTVGMGLTEVHCCMGYSECISRSSAAVFHNASPVFHSASLVFHNALPVLHNASHVFHSAGAPSVSRPSTICVYMVGGHSWIIPQFTMLYQCFTMLYQCFTVLHKCFTVLELQVSPDQALYVYIW